jgi:hypothetical protein
MDNTVQKLMTSQRKAEVRNESARILQALGKLVDFQALAKEANEDTSLYDTAISNATVQLAALSNELQADLDYREALKSNSESA